MRYAHRTRNKLLARVGGVRHIIFMPYTISHAIISLPAHSITRGKIPVAAFIVGSISPDFPYQLALTITKAPGHSIAGVFIYCLLPSLLILAIWYRWLEKPTLDLFWLERERVSFNKWSYLAIVFGVLIGAYSHILWDSTSHVDGYFVARSDFLRTSLFSLPLYKWNQYGSGVLGLFALFLWYIYTIFKHRKRPYKGRLILGLSIYAASILGFIVVANAIHGSSNLAEYAVRSSIGFMTGGAVAAIIYSLIVGLQYGRFMPNK